MRLGLLGGTFDPPHFGHLWLAETARAQLRLDQVLFLPAGEPPHKQARPVTAVSHRLRMLELALPPSPHFHLDTTDADRPPPHTTAGLLPLLQQAHPGAQLWLLIGSDSLRDLPTWVTPREIVPRYRLAVLPRPGVSIDWSVLETAVPGVRTAVDWLDGPQLPLSSTAIREWAGAGRSVRFLLPDPVAAYIAAHRLYDTSQMGHG
ncbi:MAG: nicotinate (nicotinamide) nucleotide adenylyltransferase [Anaerolineales bacterium]|nr:nicotinate (nicotinamide) nucleotide adenylyltransferase [Anaerolineales bacterium]